MHAFKSIFVVLLLMISNVGYASITLILQEQKMDSIAKNQTDINQRNKMFMFVGTYTADKSKGIYIYDLDMETGASEYVSEVEIDNPSYLALDPSENYLYAVSEDDDITKAAINAFSFDKEKGKLTFINKELTHGEAPCHINIDKTGNFLISANYSGGSLSIFKLKDNGGLDSVSQVINFTGKGVDLERQTQSHVHYTEFSPDQKYLFVNDLGTDNIYKFLFSKRDSVHYKIKQGVPSSFKVADGLGPRHMEFHPNGKYAYLITELGGEVLAFSYKDGNFTEIQNIVADIYSAKGSGDIHLSPDGKYLYVSKRLQNDGVVIFSVNEEDGKLEKIGFQKTDIHPRNFAITPNGKFLIVANRDSNSVQVFSRNLETGLLENTNQNISVDMPTCIKFASKR